MNPIAHEPPARCNATQRRCIVATAHALGVPHDYGRSRGLLLVREPERLTAIGLDVHGRMQWLVPRAAAAWKRMHATARDEGIVLEVVSAFRSAEYQLGILRRKLERGLTIEEILRVSAAPGYSEHHSGRVLDLTTPGYEPLEEVFEQSAAFAWLEHNAAAFGFHLSYPRGNPHGIAYEPWHWCWHPRRRNQRP
ncbi:M15 family metallopeptidase [Dokdonella sp.]|uniref:M15 family metallopeptidase n=1 Tax=Dokdonella sp. TaxID=2291710 RepID=UPI0025BE2818|nr:M15 family metallopeptidase [Dokdonella sp.]